MHRTGQEWNPYPSPWYWQLCHSGTGELPGFYVAAKLVLQTTLGHLWELSIPGRQYEFIHLVKWLLNCSNTTSTFAFLSSCSIMINICMLRSNWKNSFFPFKWEGLRHYFYVDSVKENFQEAYILSKITSLWFHFAFTSSSLLFFPGDTSPRRGMISSNCSNSLQISLTVPSLSNSLLSAKEGTMWLWR